jgi:hypothetical protein
VKFWWFADYIQYDNQRKLQKKHPRFFSERLHAPANSFISKNEGMNEQESFFLFTMPSGKSAYFAGLGDRR